MKGGDRKQSFAPSPTPEIEGFILAGGASSRMGEDKSRLRLGGLTLAARAARALSSVTGAVSVVSSRHDAGAFGLPLVRDRFEGRGALGGLHAALESASTPWAAVLSCDLPFVSGALIKRLASFLEADLDAVAPLQTDGRPQPLCALYSRAACLPEIENLLRTGELRPRVLLARLRTRWLKPEDWSDLEGSEHFFLNVNTPEEFAEALKVSSSESRVPS